MMVGMTVVMTVDSMVHEKVEMMVEMKGLKMVG